MQLLDIPTAIPDKIERLLRPVIESAAGEAHHADEWDRLEAQIVRREEDPGELEHAS